MRRARQIADDAVILGRYCKNTSPSSRLHSIRYCNTHETNTIQSIHDADTKESLETKNKVIYLAKCGIAVNNSSYL